MFPRLPSLEDPSSAEGRVGRHRSRSQPARLFVRSAWRLGPCRLTTDECPSLGAVAAVRMCLPDPRPPWPRSEGHCRRHTEQDPGALLAAGAQGGERPRPAGPGRGVGGGDTRTSPQPPPPDVPAALQKLASRAQRSRRLPTPFPSPLTQGNAGMAGCPPSQTPPVSHGCSPRVKSLHVYSRLGLCF